MLVVEPRLRGRRPRAIAVGGGDLETLERWAKGAAADVPAALAVRARIVLACSRGESHRAIAHDLGVTEQLVGRWRSRFARGGLEALVGEARPGASVQLEVATVGAPAPDAIPDWASRSTAARVARAATLLPDEHGSVGAGAALVAVHVFVSDVAFVLADLGRSRVAAAAEAAPLASLRALTRRHVAATTRRSNAVRLKRFLKDVAVAIPGGVVHVVLVSPPAGIVKRWLERRPRFVVHATGTLHAWWGLLGTWSASAPPCAEAAAAFVDAAGLEIRPFDWIATGRR